MSRNDCEAVELPAWGADAAEEEEEDMDKKESTHHERIIRILLAKLGDFLIPGTCNNLILY